MNELAVAVSEIGFPLVISIILLFRIETKLERLTKAIEDLAKSQ